MRLVFEQALKNTLRSCHSLFTYSSLMTPMGALCYTIYQMCMTADAFLNASAPDTAKGREEAEMRQFSFRPWTALPMRCPISVNLRACRKLNHIRLTAGNPMNFLLNGPQGAAQQLCIFPNILAKIEQKR